MKTEQSWERVWTTPNKFLYNGGGELNEQTANYETFYRPYDPAIGRFTGIDPLASSFASINPYQYAFNDPISLNDPNGDMPNFQALDAEKNHLIGDGVGRGNFVGWGRGYNHGLNGSVYWGSDIWSGVRQALRSTYGGNVNARTGEVTYFNSDAQALGVGLTYNGRHNSFQYTWFGGGAGGGSSSSTNASDWLTLHRQIKKDLGRYRNNIGQLKAIKRVVPKLIPIVAPVTATISGLGPIGLEGDGLNVVGYSSVILMNRITETSKSTISEFAIYTDAQNVDPLRGYFLEPTGPSTTLTGKDRRIPTGAYVVDPFTRPNDDKVFIIHNGEVSTSRRILIHVGNYPCDTEGCFLPGSTYSTDFIGSGTKTMTEITNFLNEYGTKAIRLIISNDGL